MCVIHISVRCSEKFSELLVGDERNAELTVESVIGTALLELFETVVVDGVKLLTSQSTTESSEREWE